MANYKISGLTTDDAKVHIFKDDAYQGYKDITSGSYEVNFALDDATGVTAVAEKSDGQVVGSGDITAVSGGASDITLPASVRLIQPFSFTQLDGDWTYNHTLSTSVDTDNSFIISTGNTVTGQAIEYRKFTSLALTSSTNVLSTRWDSSEAYYNADVFVCGFVLEFESGVINSIQRGTKDIGRGTAGQFQVVNTTITAVDLTKSFVTFSFYYKDTYDQTDPVLYLPSSTVMRIERHITSSTKAAMTIAYEVVEFA